MRSPRTGAACRRTLFAGALTLLLAGGGQAVDRGSSSRATLDERLGNLLDARPGDGRGCVAGPQGPLRLPPRPTTAALGVKFADGRFARWDSLRLLGAEPYWPLENACSALDATLLWDPARLAGEILLDTLHCRFVVGSELLHCGEHTVQLADRVLYVENRLFLPISFAARVVSALLPERWQFDRDSLLLAQRAIGPAVSHLRIQEVRPRTYLRWEAAQRPTEELYADGAGHLIVDLGGVHLDPLQEIRPEVRSGTCLGEIWPGAQGTRFVFEVDPRIVGWRSEWRGDRGEYRLILTTDRDDLTGWQTFRSWDPGAQSSGWVSRAQPLVLVLPDLSADGLRGAEAPERDALRFVHEVGERIAAAWRSMGGRVEIVEHPTRSTRSPWSAAANARHGAACLRLIPDFVCDGVGSGYRVVVGSATPVGRSLRRLDVDETPAAEESPAADEDWDASDASGAESAPHFRSWPGVSAVHAYDSGQLAWVLALHLQATAPRVAVRRETWPSAALRGLDMPGVVLYIGRRGAAGDFPGPEDELSLAPISEALALALEAFQIRRGAGEGQK